LDKRQVSRTFTNTGYGSEIGKAVAAAISNASNREKRIGDIGMFKGGCLPGSSAARVWSSGVKPITGAASVSGATSVSGSTEREEGEETDKYTANICNTEHAKL
jgi:hypothetical protein